MSAPSVSQTHELAHERDHVPTLDGLRGVAILAIVAFHIAVVASSNASWAYDASPPWYAWPLFAGSLGVDIFLVLSGFLVLRSWRSLRARYDPDGIRALGQFARRRAWRILPPYWFALLVLIPWRAPHWLETTDGLSNIFMFASLNQFLDPELPRQLNTVTWTLTTEIHFYLLLPILAFIGVRYGWGRLLACMLMTSIAWRLAAGGTGGAAEWILGRGDQFVAGMAAAELVDAARTREPSRLMRVLKSRFAGWALGSTLAVVAMVHGATRLLPKPLVWLSVFHSVAGLCIAGLCVRAVCGEGLAPLRNRLLGSVGLISYSLYLWHWPLLAEASARWGPSSLVLGAGLAAGLVASIVSYATLERPFPGRRRSTDIGRTRDARAEPMVASAIASRAEYAAGA